MAVLFTIFTIIFMLLCCVIGYLLWDIHRSVKEISQSLEHLQGSLGLLIVGLVILLHEAVKDDPGLLEKLDLKLLGNTRKRLLSK